MMKSIAVALALLSTTACSKKTPSCADVFEHTKSLMPEMAEKLDKQKDAALAKCEKLSDDAKSCAMNASSIEELQKCPRE